MDAQGPSREQERHREHVERIAAMEQQIAALIAREEELKVEIPKLERTLRVKPEPENVDELREQLKSMHAEKPALGPALIEARVRLGLLMSDFALNEDADHEQAIDDLKPLSDKLRSAYNRALYDADRTVKNEEQALAQLRANEETPVEDLVRQARRCLQPLIDAETIGVMIATVNLRLNRHRLRLVSADDLDSLRSRERALEDAEDELDAARKKVSDLQASQQALVQQQIPKHRKVDSGRRKGKHALKALEQHRPHLHLHR